MATAPLPHLSVTWDPYTDSDFLRYNVYYRERRSIHDARESVDVSVTGGVTDALRVLGVEGDARAWPDNSLGFYPAATNYVNDGSFETVPTYWTTGGTNSVAASTEQAKFGTTSVKCTYGNSATLLSSAASLTHSGAVPHTASAYVYIPSTFDGSSVTVGVNSLTGATGTLTANADLSLRDQWQRVTAGPYTPDAGDLTGGFAVTVGGTPTVGRYLYVDGAQVEANAVATPFVLTTAATDVTRDAARVLLPAADVLSAVRGGFALRTRVNWSNSAEPTTPTYLDFRDDASNYLSLYYDTSANAWTLARNVATDLDTAAVSDAVSAGDVVTLVGYWTDSTIYLSVDGSAFTSAATGTPTSNLDAAYVDLGSKAGAQQAYSDVFWAVLFGGELTAADAAVLHGFGNTAPVPEDLRNLSAEAVPTLLWSARRTDEAVQVDAADWVVVAELTDQYDPRYRYFRAASGKTYEFAVTVVANVYGDVLESDKQDVPAADSCSFDDLYVQEVADPGDDVRFAAFSGSAVSLQARQEIAYVRPRGRTAPSAQIGEYEARRLTLSGVPRYHDTERAEYERLWELVRRQRTSGSVLLLRPPHVPERYFVQVDPLSRSDDVPTYELRVDFQEVHYDEDAST